MGGANNTELGKRCNQSTYAFANVSCQEEGSDDNEKSSNHEEHNSQCNCLVGDFWWALLELDGKSPNVKQLISVLFPYNHGRDVNITAGRGQEKPLLQPPYDESCPCIPCCLGLHLHHCSDFHPPPNKWSRFYLLNKQSYFQLSCVGFLEQKGWNSVIKHGEVGLHTLGTFSNLYDSEWAWWWWVDNRNLLAEQSIFFPPHFTCRSIYPSSVLASLEYLTLLLGIPAERFVLDGIITVRCGHQLEPGKQK